MREFEAPPREILAAVDFALAGREEEELGNLVRARVMQAAVQTRPPGRPTQRAAHVTGLAAFSQAVAQMDSVLRELSEPEWSRPARRDLDVQGLIGHLIGVETAFADSLEGLADLPGADEHVSSTQAAAAAQAGRRPQHTRQEWAGRAARTIALAERRPPSSQASFYGAVFALDEVLVARAFETWAHHEDVRRATGRRPQAPPPSVLARMVDLATSLLPGAIVRGGWARAHRRARLVLTGAGGGTWDVPFDGQWAAGRSRTGHDGRWATGLGLGTAEVGSRRSDTVVVVGSAEFCRVVGNRGDLDQSGAVVSGDRGLAHDLFAAAASLALD